MVHAAASIAVRDGVVESLGRKLDEHTQRSWIRGFVVAILLVSYAVAVLYQGTLVPLLLFGYGMVVQFAPVVVATLYWRRATGVGVLAGLVVGSVATLAMVIAPSLRPIAVHPGLQGALLNVIVLVAVSLATSPDRSGRTLRFLEIAAGRMPDARRD